MIWFSRKIGIFARWSDNIIYVKPLSINRARRSDDDSWSWSWIKDFCCCVKRGSSNENEYEGDFSDYIVFWGEEITWPATFIFTRSTSILGTIFCVLQSKSTIELDNNKAKTIENTPFRILISTIKFTVRGGGSLYLFTWSHRRIRWATIKLGGWVPLMKCWCCGWIGLSK